MVEEEDEEDEVLDGEKSDEEDTDGEEEEEEEETVEKFHEDEEEEVEVDQEGKEKVEKEDYVDIGTSFLEAYKNLSPNQIKSMTKDTKQLLNVQKNLMKTIEGLTPIVKEGKSVLDTFKGYFDELK